MRQDAAVFAVRNAAAHKAPRFVVKIEFPAYSLYLSSHGDITGIPSVHLAGCVIEPSISSQRLNPDQGRAEIGAASFVVSDRSSGLTAQLRSLLAGGAGLRNRTVRFYLGYEGMLWDEFVCVGTQIVKEAAFDRGAYRISCNDIQRAARKDIFATASTTLSATVEATDTTVSVYSTIGFERCFHSAGWSDAASQTVGYLKIKDEIIRYTGQTATAFTGCTRGVLGTAAARYAVDGATASARREKVSEYVYLEMPGVKLLYAILTGQMYGDGVSLPASWHLGIDPTLIRLADFTGIGPDLWDPTSDLVGVALRFEGLGKTDGKAFIETEINRLLGLFMPVHTDGTLGLKRMTRVLADATGVVTLDESNSVTVGDLHHDMESLHNAFAVRWNWNGKDYTRTTLYLDAASASVHGRASEMELKFKGLYGGKHTDGVVFKLLDSIRDRYSAPPQRLDVEVLHSLNALEVGDVVRVRHRMLRDYAAADEWMDRAFEVQSVTVNHRTGAVALDLFGSTSTAAVTSPTTPTIAAEDGFYSSAGTALTSVMTISGGVVSGGPYTLAGSADITAAASIWYYLGDLTIPESVTINISGNVQLRVRGYLTINGTINGIGGGLAGVADNSEATTVIAGNAGFVGNVRGHDGIIVTAQNADRIKLKSYPPAVTIAKYEAVPHVLLEVSGTAILGIPTDLRGSGGGPGGKVVKAPRVFGLSVEWVAFLRAGGTGADGGAGLCTVTRGLGLGANARIDLSGEDAAAPTAHYETVDGQQVAYFPGTGAPGGPGSWLCLIDGGLLSVPDLSGRFVARTGRTALPSYKTALTGTAEEKWNKRDRPFAGWVENPSVTDGLDLSYVCQRIQYVPASETPIADSEALSPPTNITITQSASGYVVSFAAATGTPDGTIFEVHEHTAATPFTSAVKRAEGAATAFFMPRGTTTTVYVWVRARYRDGTGRVIYSTQIPAADGIPAAAAAVAGTYATATPTSLAATAASASVTTGNCTAGLVGGTGSTFAWSRISGSASIVANSPTTATTSFTGSGIGVGATVSAVYRCTVNSTYSVDVPVSCSNTGSTLALSVAPATITATADAATITTTAATAAASGGAGGYSYAWALVSGGAISAVAPTSAATTFTATAMAAGESRSALMRCTVTDADSSSVTADVSVTVTRQAAIIVTLYPTSLYRSGSAETLTTAVTTATVTGGAAPYSYAWAKVSGDAITAVTPTGAATSFRAAALAAEEVRTATFRVTVTDSASLTATRDINVAIVRTGYA